MPYWLRGNWSRLLVALLLSLLAHLWLAGGLHFAMPVWEENEPIVVRLVNPPPAKLAAPSVTAKPAAAKPRPRPAPQLKPAPPAEPSPSPAPEVSPQPQPSAAMEPTPEPPKAEEHAAVEEQPAMPAEEEKLPPPPHHVEIDFQVVRNGITAGVVRHSYLASEDGSYALNSAIEPQGVLSLFVSHLMESSTGQITEHGLTPSIYVYQYGSNPDKTRKATFDWQGKTLTMESKGRHQSVELQDGAQDVLSFMYQFMFVPPLQEMQLAITNGKNYHIYDYLFEGEETLETKIGPLRTWHMAQSSGNGEEKKELWVATDYHFLPVRIRITDKDGAVMEGTVTRLQME